MIRRTVRRSEYEKTPYAAWNAFVDLVAMESRLGKHKINQLMLYSLP